MPNLNNIIRKSPKIIEYYDFEDLRFLIDQLDIPIAIINTENLDVILANNLFCHESKYAYDELGNIQISRIIGNFENLKNSDGLALTGDFIKKNNEIIRCKYSWRFLGKTKNQAMILFDFVKGEEEKEINFQTSLIENFQQIIEDVISNKNLNIETYIFEKAIEVFTPIEGALYSKNDHNEFIKIASHKQKRFPERIASIEVSSLKKQDIWSAGKRVLNSIHRAGRINNLPLIITTPIQLKANSNIFLVLSFGDVHYEEIIGKYIKIFCLYADRINEIVRIALENTNLSSSVNLKNALVKLIFENIQVGGLIYDESGMIIQANQFALDLLGYSISEIQQERIDNIFSEEKILSNLYINEPATFEHDESITIHHRGGRGIPVTFSIIPFSEETDQLFLMLIDDIRESIEQKNQLTTLEGKAVLGEMVADFAHEVRNPINNISTGLQLMKARLTENDRNQEVVERMLNDCIRMNLLMDSILSFSRQNYSDFKHLDLNQFVQRLASRFMEKAKTQNIKITIIKEMENIFIAGDVRALEQVFINIISNAIDILENEGGVISIKTSINKQKPDAVLITISDTGHGIPEDLRPHLFEPFVSSKPKGTGLGLAITKRIIEAHNGTIQIETFTTGTIISITLPVLNQGELHWDTQS